MPYDVVKRFEKKVCEYTGAKYAVTTNSCTMALLLALVRHSKNAFGFVLDDFDRRCVSIPKRTYVSVPMSIIHAGCHPVFRDVNWLGQYRLEPLPVWDSARTFTSGMYLKGQMQCVSFHASKILGDTQGGAILHDDDEADAWFRRMRFDGRTEGVAPIKDSFKEIGYHCYMSPDVASRLLLKLYSLPKNNDPLPNDDYPDLDSLEIFK